MQTPKPANSPGSESGLRPADNHTCSECGEPGTFESIRNSFGMDVERTLCNKEECLESWRAKRKILAEEYLAAEKEKRERQEAAEKAERDRQEIRYRAENIEPFLEKAGIPLRLILEGCSFENFQGRVPTNQPSFIYGPPGVGKTYLAAAYLRAELLTLGGSGKFLRVVDLSTDLRSAAKNDFGGDVEILKEYSRIAFLILDDLGAEKVTEFTAQSLYALIDHRYSECLPTIITSNLTLDQLAERYGMHGERLASRIAGMGEPLGLAGKDRRWQ